MPVGDSLCHPFVLTPLQTLRPSLLLIDTFGNNLREEMINHFHGEGTNTKEITGILNSNTQDSNNMNNNIIIQGLITRLEALESSNLVMRTEICELTN